MKADTVKDIRLLKPTPHVVAKIDRRVKKASREKAIKAEVKARAKSLCQCCAKARGEETHELLFRSLGGVVSLENSIYVCGWRGNNCHRLLQTLVILAKKLTKAGADGPIRYTDTRDKRTWVH